MMIRVQPPQLYRPSLPIPEHPVGEPQQPSPEQNHHCPRGLACLSDAGSVEMHKSCAVTGEGSEETEPGASEVSAAA